MKSNGIGSDESRFPIRIDSSESRLGKPFPLPLIGLQSAMDAPFTGVRAALVSTGGQIDIKTDHIKPIAADCAIRRDASTLAATKQSSSALDTMPRVGGGGVEGVSAEHADSMTAIVTIDKAVSALATDAVGGVIVAHQAANKPMVCAAPGYTESVRMKAGYTRTTA